MTTFHFDDEQLNTLTEFTLETASKYGASSAEVNIGENIGQTVTVRLNSLETTAYNRDTSLNVTVYIDQSKGSASTSDLSKKGIEDTVNAAVAIARYTANDPYAGLADPLLFAKDFKDLDLYHPFDISIETAVDMAKEMEQSGMNLDARIDNSSGASVTSQAAQAIYANSLGFAGIERESYYSASVALVANENGSLQQDYWFDAARRFSDLQRMQAIGQKAGERVLHRLNARRVKTANVPVLFDATIARSLIGNWVTAVSGGSLYRRTSFLVDSLETPVFSPIVQIKELPHIPRAFSSRNFDAEGVATKERDMVTDGILHGYFLGSYSARKLSMTTTGNAGGAHNLDIQSTHDGLAALLAEMHTGLWVTELMGHGVNMVTGDYSRGASGFWVENGQIQYPVEEITIAGNLKTMFQGIVGIGNDRIHHSSWQCGSILIDNMMVAGE